MHSKKVSEIQTTNAVAVKNKFNNKRSKSCINQSVNIFTGANARYFGEKNTNSKERITSGKNIDQFKSTG